MKPSAIAFSCALSNTDMDALLQAQQTLSLLGKLTDQFMQSAGITGDETAAVAGYASTQLAGLIDRLHEGPLVSLNVTEGPRHAR